MHIPHTFAASLPFFTQHLVAKVIFLMQWSLLSAKDATRSTMEAFCQEEDLFLGNPAAG